MRDEFERLAKLEPELRDLERMARDGWALYPDESGAMEFWYTTLKPRIVRLVGWYRRPFGAPEVERVTHPAGFIVFSDALDAWGRQLLADAAALARSGPAAAFVHRELSTTEAYHTVYFHLLDVLEGRA